MKVLLLAGTQEARALAARLAADPRVEVIASLAGETRAPIDLGVPTRVGGFGGEARQAAFIAAEGVGAVIDATHPFAAHISRRTAQICARLDVPYLQLLRPGWAPEPGDRWTFVADEAAVAGELAKQATVFLATGRKTLDRFKNLAGHKVFARVIDAPAGDCPIPGGEYLLGRPPFEADEERLLFQSLGIDVLVAKDAGGPAGRGKLAAARTLGLPVVLIRRPPQPPGEKAETVDQALAWLERQL